MRKERIVFLGAVWASVGLLWACSGSSEPREADLDAQADMGDALAEDSDEEDVAQDLAELLDVPDLGSDGEAEVADTGPDVRGHIAVETGCFLMGSPDSEAEEYGDARYWDERQHTVCITHPFELKRTEVTQAEWREVMGSSPSYFEDCDDCPVEQVSWWDAVTYCNTLSVAEGLEPCYELLGCTSVPPGNGCLYQNCDGDYYCEYGLFAGLECKGYRLPTEAEWEYSVRAGTTTPRYGELEEIAWGALHDEEGHTYAVAGKLPNGWGFYDMLGNVNEWCGDWYDPEYYFDSPEEDPLGPVDGVRIPFFGGPTRVLRGSSWQTPSTLIRAADRGFFLPINRSNILGFRTARSL